MKGFYLFLLTIVISLHADDLLRGTMEIDSKGHLHIGGCDVCEISQESAYPVYVIDETLIRKNMHEYVHSLKDSYSQPGFVYYASKAMMNMAICKIAEQEEMGLDVASGGELYTAISAQFPMERIIFHGNNKSEEELRMALKHGVGRIALDNLDEARVLDKLSQEMGILANVLVRVKPGVHADTHHYIVTGTEDSKFGFNISDGNALEAIEEISKMPGIIFKGIHCHIGSQILSLDGFGKAVEVLAPFCQVLKERGILVKELDFGGGLGTVYTSQDHKMSISEYICFVTSKVIDQFQERHLPLPVLMFEPGRSIIAEAGTTLYRVGSIKEVGNGLLYVAVNGGMADNIRPSLYSAKYYALLANRSLEEKTTQVRVVGKCCESGDILIQGISLPKPKAGDTLAVFTTGAYNYSMASNYNRLPVPGVLLVCEGRSEWIVVPQDMADLVRNDRIPERLTTRAKP